MTTLAARRSNAASVFAPFHALATAFTTWNNSRATRRALYALTDRELDDIGLCRGDIDRF